MVMVSEKAFENKVKIRNNVKILIQNIEILKLPPLALKVEWFTDMNIYDIKSFVHNFLCISFCYVHLYKYTLFH